MCGKVATWIENLTGQTVEEENMFALLKDGILLCQAIGKIQPKFIDMSKVVNSPIPFKQMENISIFLRACRRLGVPESDCFETVDLYNQKDFGSVIRCLYALDRAIQKHLPTYDGPRLGIVYIKPSPVEPVHLSVLKASTGAHEASNMVAPLALKTIKFAEEPTRCSHVIKENQHGFAALLWDSKTMKYEIM